MEVPEIAIENSNWRTIRMVEALRRLQTYLGQSRRPAPVVLWNSAAVMARTGRAPWKDRCEIALLVRADPKGLHTRAAELFGGDASGIDGGFSVYEAGMVTSERWMDLETTVNVELFPVSVGRTGPFANEQSFLRDWMFRTATPLTVAATDATFQPPGVERATFLVAASGPLLASKLAELERADEHTFSTFCEVAALVEAGAGSDLMQALANELKAHRERGLVLLEITSAVVGDVTANLTRWREELVFSEGHRHPNVTYPTDQELLAVVDTVGHLCEQLYKVKQLVAGKNAKYPETNAPTVATDGIRREVFVSDEPGDGVREQPGRTVPRRHVGRTASPHFDQARPTLPRPPGKPSSKPGPRHRPPPGRLF